MRHLLGMGMVWAVALLTADPEMGKAWTTLVSGDAGLNWRTRVLVIEPATHTIEAVVNAPWDVNGSSSIVVGGSHVYCSRRRSPTKWRPRLAAGASTRRRSRSST